MPAKTHYSKLFITPEKFDSTKKKALAGPNGWLLFVACNSGIDFAKEVKDKYEKFLVENGSDLEEIPIIGDSDNKITTIFEDTESCPRLTQNVAGSNAYVFQNVHEQSSNNSVNENIQQLLQVVRTLRAHRAKTITVVTPYMPYSRQDKPTFMKREATLARLYADQIKVAGADMYLTYHPHTYSLYGLFEPNVTLVAISGLDLLIKIFQDKMNMQDVITVSTDAGGAKFTIHFANAMDITYGISNKFRKAKDKSQLLGIIGDMDGKKSALIVDDETVTGSSILNAAECLYKNYNIEKIYAAVTHFKVRKEYLKKFINANKNYGLEEFHITDSIPQIKELNEIDFIKIHSLAGRMAATINRLHYNQSVKELSYNPNKK